MSPARARWPGAVVAALALVAPVLLVQALGGGSFLGATPLLIAACGLALLPYLPDDLQRRSIRVAVVPALGIASFATVVTTVSLVGIPLGAVSIPLAAAAFVLVAALGSLWLDRKSGADTRLSPRRELLILVLLAAIASVALASSWDRAYPFEARGTDWGHYLLYADEVADQGHLLIDDPFAGEDDRIFADPAAVGALYGSVLLLDGVSSWSLTGGIVILSALTVLSLFVAAAVLWGSRAGLAAAGAYAVAPVRLEPMAWHGLGTTLAMVFVPLVVMVLGLLYRGERGWRHTLLLTVGLLGVATAHPTSAVVVGALLLIAPVVDLAAQLVSGWRAPREALRGWWSAGIARTVASALGLSCVLGAGVVLHLGLQGRALGTPVSYRFLGPDWLDRAAVEHYFSVPFLVLALVAVMVVLTSRRLAHDRSLLALVSLAFACAVVGQLWRVHVSFDYQRVVYLAGVGIALLIGATSTRRRAHAVWITIFALAFVWVGRTSIGLRLPVRVVHTEPRSAAVTGLTRFRDHLDRGVLPDTRLIVSDACLHFAVPYLARRPTIPAFSERQVGFVDRMPLARQAAAILAGDPEGVTLARRLGVGYAVADPDCADLETTLGGSTVVANQELVIVRLTER